MTPDPRLVELIDTVQHELPDWTPPALPHGDAADLLDRLAGERLQDALTLLWPDGVSAQDVGLRLLVAIDVIEHESAVWTAIGAGHYQAEAWQREADRITKAIAREQRDCICHRGPADDPSDCGCSAVVLDTGQCSECGHRVGG